MTRSSRRIRTFALPLALFATSLVARVTVAQPSDAISKSKRLFDEARELMNSGDFAKACPKLEESVRLKPGLGARFNLADCWEHIGRHASARVLFLDVAGDAENSGQTERHDVAVQRAEALESKVQRLLVKVEAPAEGLELARDEAPLEEAKWGSPFAIDPGTYSISAKAPGKKSWSSKVEVPAAPSGLLVAVAVPPLEPTEPPRKVPPKEPEEAATARGKPKAAAAPPKPAATPKSSEGGTARSIAFILGGAGVGALFVGGVAALEYRSKNGDAEATCPLGVACTPADIEAHDRAVEQARTARGIAFVGFGIGAAALAGAVGFYAFGGPSSERASVAAGPLVGSDGSLGAQVAGSF